MTRAQVAYVRNSELGSVAEAHSDNEHVIAPGVYFDTNAVISYAAVLLAVQTAGEVFSRWSSASSYYGTPLNFRGTSRPPSRDDLMQLLELHLGHGTQNHQVVSIFPERAKFLAQCKLLDSVGGPSRLLFHQTSESSSSPVEADTHYSSTAEVVRDVHLKSGLTWEQLSRALGVSRRALHGWAAGKKVSAANMERLVRVFDAVEQLSSDSPEDRRQELLAPRRGQPSIYDELRMDSRRGKPVENTVPVRELVAGHFGVPATDE